MNITTLSNPYSPTRSSMPRTNQAPAQSGGSSLRLDKGGPGAVADGCRPAEAERFAVGPNSNQASMGEEFQKFRTLLRELHSLPYIKPYTPFVDSPEAESLAKTVDQQLFHLCKDIFIGDDVIEAGSGRNIDANSMGLIADNAQTTISKDGVPCTAERARQRALSIYLQNGGPGSSSIADDIHHLLQIALGL